MRRRIGYASAKRGNVWTRNRPCSAIAIRAAKTAATQHASDLTADGSAVIATAAVARHGRVFDHGDLRYVLLQLIAEKPRYGYELIKTIEESFSAACYSPSPGVVYPTLTLLEELGYLRPESSSGSKKLYSLTEEGAAFLTANRALVDAIFARMAQTARALAADRRPRSFGRCGTSKWRCRSGSAAARLRRMRAHDRRSARPGRRRDRTHQPR